MVIKQHSIEYLIKLARSVYKWRFVYTKIVPRSSLTKNMFLETCRQGAKFATTHTYGEN